MNQYWRSLNDEGKSTFKIGAVFEENSLALKLFKNETAWEANVSKDELAAQSENHNISFDEYYANLKTYIDCFPEDVDFKFKSAEFRINVILKNKMKILYFHSFLTKVNFTESMFSLTESLYNKNVEYFMELNNLRSQHATLKNDHDTMENKLTEFLEVRPRELQKIFNNFTAILNEKKRQIQHLNDLLIAFRQGRPTVNPPAQVKRKINSKAALKSKKAIKKTPQSSSESESDNGSNKEDDYDTDETGQANNNRQSNNMSPVLSTSKISDEALPLLPDAHSQPFTFPKRIRRENNTNMDTILPKKEVIKKEEPESTRDFANAKKEPPPKVAFDTQDLLDNL